MKKILMLPLLFGFSGAVSAGGDNSAIDILQQISAPAVPSAVNPAIPARAVSLPQNFSYGYTWQESCADGGLPFEYSGRKYFVRLGFERGTFDSYIKNYKAVTGIILSELRAPNDLTVWAFNTLAQIQSGNVGFTLNDGSGVYLKFNGDLVWLTNNTGNTIVSIKYADLKSAWEQNAKKYSRFYGPNIEYFVPQAYMDISKGWHSGYVVSEYAPYYPNSGLPLDYIELFKSKGTTEFKPIAYSIPLGLSFKYLGNQGQPWIWTVSELTQADLGNALADELKSRSPNVSDLLSPSAGVTVK